MQKPGWLLQSKEDNTMKVRPSVKLAYDPAISRLQGINLPEAWNNLGVAYAMKKDYTTAMQYFDQAAQAGVQDAAANRDELAAWLAEQ